MTLSRFFSSYWLVLIAAAIIILGFTFAIIGLQQQQKIQSYGATGVGASCNIPGGYATGQSRLYGTCLDRNTTSCSGFYDSGWYCPGGASIQCCIPGPVACTPPDGQGVCKNRSGGNAYSCAGGHYNSGNYCPGPDDVQCCIEPPAPPADTTAPSVPGTLIATAVSTSQINLSWTASTDSVGVKGYKIFRDGVEIGTATTTSYQDKGLTQDKTYKYTVSAYDAAGNNSAKSNEASAKTTSSLTTFTLDLLFHGIGKGGDNKNPTGGGNPSPAHAARNVVVDVYDLNDEAVVTNKQGQVTFDPVSGSYKGSVTVGTLLTTGSYQIRVKLSHSLFGKTSKNITSGTTNTIPVMTLVNGDTNNDAKLDILDYDIIRGCYTDFNLPPENCDAAKKTMADIDDDGNVNQFDLNLFLREMSVQQL